MKPDEKLTKEHGRPVIKGVMDHDDLLDPDNVEPPEETIPREPRTQTGANGWARELPEDDD